MDTHALVKALISHRDRASKQELDQMVNTASEATFATDLIAVDAPLQGDFWQFDVLAAGSRLPVGEVALLRAMRLDKDWHEEDTVETFTEDLQQAITHPNAAVWTLTAAESPCIVFAAPAKHKRLTVVWYCAETDLLYAGYQTSGVYLLGAVMHRPLPIATRQIPPPRWLADSLAHREDIEDDSHAFQLDHEILKIRRMPNM